MKIRLLPFAFFAALLAAGCGQKDVPATVSVTSSTPTAAASTSTPAAAPSAPAASPSATAASTGSASTAAAAAAATAAAKEPAGAGRVIEITANDQMKFSLATIEAKAGETLKVVLTNVGTLPKVAMGHNWVLLKAGTDVMGFATASMTAKDSNYISPAMKDQVIASVGLLGPKEKGEATFTAPAAGEYTYICSFPGHAALMKGVLTVK